VLAKLAKVLDEINCDGIKAQLHIFSGSKLGKRKEKKLNDGKNSFLLGQISYEDLTERYKSFDIAVHVESFDLKNRLITRLSFSTKIIDCLCSGCAVLAIGPSIQGGISYLKENDAAVCVTDLKELNLAVSNLVTHFDVIEEYSKKANKLGMQNHQKDKIEKNLRQDFHDVVTGSFQQQY
jgi:hypothetical protein